MKLNVRNISGIILGALAAISVALFVTGGSIAQDSSGGDRCPATSKAKCDGLLLPSIGL